MVKVMVKVKIRTLLAQTLRLYLHLWLKTLVFSLPFIFLASNTALAQRLTIETPSSGPLTRVFYGHLNETEFSIFEKKIKLEAESNDLQSDSNGPTSPPEIEVDTNASKSTTTLASMQIRVDEITKCTKNPRVRGFITLTASMKGKVNSAKILVGPAADSCAEEVSAALGASIGPIKITNQNTDQLGIKIELAIQTTAPAAPLPTPKLAESKSDRLLTLEQILRRARLTVDEKPVKFNAEGWFIFETDQNREVLVALKLPGRKEIVISSFPVNVTKTPRQIATASTYNSLIGIFASRELRIYVTDVPFLAQKTTIDGGAGGGIGYGREVPGERRGERLVSMLGIEKRQIIANLGLRGSLLYTNASKTAVPQTFTVRGTGLYDHNFEDEALALRVALGAEIFYSKILESKETQKVGQSSKAAIIPSQVLAPLVGFSLHKIFRNGLVLTPAIHITPLFIASVGFYPAISPSVDLGYKIKKDLFAILSAGSEVHRFPSELGETKLQMDYLTLTFKRGLL